MQVDKEKTVRITMRADDVETLISELIGALRVSRFNEESMRRQLVKAMDGNPRFCACSLDDMLSDLMEDDGK